MISDSRKSPDSVGTDAHGPGEELTSKLEPPRRKRHRLRRGLALGMVLLVLLVFCLPYIVSSGPGTRLVVNVAQRAIPGKVAIQDIAINWLGPCSISGLTLRDLKGNEVLNIGRIDTTQGLWRTVRSFAAFGQVTIAAPRCALYLDADGRPSLIDALTSGGAERKDQAPSALPPLTGRLVVQDGSVRIVRPDARQLELSGVRTSIDLDKLDRVTATLSVQPAQGEELTAEANVQGLTAGGKLQVLGATGTVRVSTPTEISVAQLLAFGLDQVQAGGKVKLAVDAKLESGAIQTDLDARISGLQVRQGTAGRGEPLDQHVTANVRVKSDSLTGNVAVEGQAGTADFRATYALGENAPSVSLEQILAGILAGKPGLLPKASVEGRCTLELARLARAVPALLRVRPGWELTGGKLEIKDLAIAGGESSSAKALISFSQLAARSAEKTVQWDPISLNLMVMVERDQGLKVQQGDLASGFGRLSARGSASEIHAETEVDLTALYREASQVFDLGTAEIAGKIAGSLDLKRAGEDRIGFVDSFTADGLRYAAAGGRVEIGKAMLTNRGHLDLGGSNLRELSLSESKIDLDGKVVATATGSCRPAEGRYAADLSISQADAGYLGDTLTKLGVVRAAKYGGTGSLQLGIQKSAREAPLVSNGRVSLRNASIGGKALSDDDITCEWADVAFAPAQRQLKVKTAKLSSSVARLSATAVDCTFSDKATAAGSFEGGADLARLMSAIAAYRGQEKPPAVSGALVLKGNCDSTPDLVSLTSEWRIDGLEIGVGEKRIREKAVRLVADSRLSRASDTLEIARAELLSDLLTLRLAGKVTDLARSQNLALKGDYKGSWASITALLHELAPTTADSLAMTGTCASGFEITGAAHQPAVRPTFQDVKSGTDISFDSVKAYGMELGKGVLSPALGNGELRVPIMVVPASGGGQVRLGGTVDFHSSDPTLRLKEKLQVMENIPVTPQLARQLLSRVNPVFGNVTHAEGAASLAVQGVELPLSEAIKKQGVGQGRLDLHDLKIKPAGLLAEVIALGGLKSEETCTVKVDGLDFVLKDGRLAYEKFMLTFAGDFDVRFRGSVGFDDTLDMTMSVPVRPALLERFGVRGVAGEYAKLLADSRVEIPLAGTRLNPKLDMARVDMKPLIQRAMRDSAGQTTGNLLQGLSGQKAPAQKAPAQAVPPAGDQRKPESAAQEALKALQGLQKKPAPTPSQERRP